MAKSLHPQFGRILTKIDVFGNVSLVGASRFVPEFCEYARQAQLNRLMDREVVYVPLSGVSQNFAMNCICSHLGASKTHHDSLTEAIKNRKILLALDGIDSIIGDDKLSIETQGLLCAASSDSLSSLKIVFCSDRELDLFLPFGKTTSVMDTCVLARIEV